MGISQGVAKLFVFKRQTAKGTMATNTGGQILRRTDGSISLNKETYDTASEITSTQQLKSSRHGIRSTQGQLNGLLSPGTYADFMQALLRKDVAAGPTTGALVNVTAAATGPHFTRATGSFLTDGFKIGDIVRWTGWTVATANNAKNFLITALTATQMTVIALDGSAVVAKAAGDSVTCSLQGKKSLVPSSGHTNIYYTIEEWHPEVPKSVRSTDVKVQQCQISFPSSGNVTANFGLVGLDQSVNASQYFGSPTAETTTNILASACGYLLIGGTAVGVVTSADITIDGQEQAADGVVGSNVRPDVFRSKVIVSGNISAYFDGNALQDAFINETETSLILVNTDGTSANSDFVALKMDRIKVNSEDRQDNETGIVAKYTFQALYNAAGGTGTATDQTTISYQDSTL